MLDNIGEPPDAPWSTMNDGPDVWLLERGYPVLLLGTLEWWQVEDPAFRLAVDWQLVREHLPGMWRTA